MRTLTFSILFAALGATPAMAAFPGFYVGAGIGQSTIRNDYYDDRQHDFGFSLTAGIRPIPLLGAEISYVDLGNRRNDDYWNCYGYCGDDGHIRSWGGAAFAVVYLPIPLTLVDLYAKAGVAVLDSRQRFFNATGCGNNGCVGYYQDDDQTNTGFAWGAGIQVHWWNLAFRGEYEQFQNQIGRPNLASAGVYWTF